MNRTKYLRRAIFIVSTAVLIEAFTFSCFAGGNAVSYQAVTLGPGAPGGNDQNAFADGTQNNYDLSDNIIDLYEIPELIEKFGKLARSQDAQISAFSDAYDDVNSAYSGSYQEIKDNYDDMIEELQAEYDDAEDKGTKASVKAEIASLKKQKKHDLQEVQDARDDMNIQEKSRISSIKRNLYNSKKTVANTYQGLIFDYKNLELKRTSAEKSVELYQAEYAKLQTQFATGGATALNVQDAKLKLESAENNLEGIIYTMDSLKRTIGIGLGWSLENYKNITFSQIPDYQLNYADTRDLETDIQLAYQQNYAMGQAYSIKDADFTAWNHKSITIDKTQKQIQIAMESLLNTVREKQQALEAAKTSLQLAYKNQSTADTKLASGLVSRSEYITLHQNYIDKNNSAEVAKLEYQRAVFNYEQAVTKGIMSLGN